MPRPIDREVTRILAERREFPVVDVVEAIAAFGQPELLKTDDRQADLFPLPAAAATDTIAAPLAALTEGPLSFRSIGQFADITACDGRARQRSTHGNETTCFDRHITGPKSDPTNRVQMGVAACSCEQESAAHEGRWLSINRARHHHFCELFVCHLIIPKLLPIVQASQRGPLA